MRKLATAFLVLPWVLTHCATPPPPTEMTREEMIRRENLLSQTLMEKVASKFHVIHDLELSVFLRSVAEKVAKASPHTRDTPIGVFLIQDEGNRWTTFGVPGNRLYVSVNLAKALEHENTLAAVLAFELAHLGNRHLAKRPQISPDLSLTLEEQQESMRDATAALYEAGYDPRGMDELLLILGQHPQTGFTPETLRSLRAEARATTVSLPPLRNPTIRTADFLRFKKRLEGRS